MLQCNTVKKHYTSSYLEAEANKNSSDNKLASENMVLSTTGDKEKAESKKKIVITYSSTKELQFTDCLKFMINNHKN